MNPMNTARRLSGVAALVALTFVAPGSGLAADPRVGPGSIRPGHGLVSAGAADGDGDGFSVAEGDCDDADPATYPGARQICDSLNNDCNHPSWPALDFTNEADIDGDGVSTCAGDCNDGDPDTHPGASEICDGFDNDCSGAIDDDAACPTECSDPRLVGPIGTPPQSMSEFLVTWTGSEIVAIWSPNLVVDLLGRFTPDGTPIGDPVEFGLAAQRRSRLPLVWNGSEFGFLQFTEDDYALQRLSIDGVRLGAPTPIGAPDAAQAFAKPALVWNGWEWVVLWLTSPADPESEPIEVRQRRLDASGRTIGEPALVFRPFEFTENAYEDLSIAATATHGEIGVVVHVAGPTDTDVLFARLDSDLELIDAPRVIGGGEFSSAGVPVGDGTHWGVALRNGFLEVRVPVVRDQDLFTGFEAFMSEADFVGMEKLETTGSEFGMLWYEFDGEPPATTHFTRIRPHADLTTTVETVELPAPGRLFWTGSDYRAWTNEWVYRVRCDCHDNDYDGFSTCEADCDDADPDTFPGARERCDGVSNDCNDSNWPDPSESELDPDEDGLPSCADNCENAANPDQTDGDGDGAGDVCDNCPTLSNPGQEDTDDDGAGNACDCAPRDPALKMPGAIPDLSLSGSAVSPTWLEWTGILFADRYRIVRGSIEGLPDGFGGCMDETTVPTFEDSDVPPPGTGFTYLVLGVSDLCGSGPAGWSSGGEARNVDAAACP